ncbi:MAG: helix-turn-helix domain-containing protein [Alphaproteobacteria bacterium]|nr:helix-turn-helix domain-containing protein [Alphaproteobacteria bacterium]
MAKSSVTMRGASKEDVRKTKKGDEENKSMEVDRIGAILYNERIKKNIDLDVIAQKLCIRRYYLEAIEKGEYKNLPSMPYSAGFVDAYAKYLGLNNTRITQLFKEEIEVKPQLVNSPSEETSAEVGMPRKFYVLLGILLVALLAWLWQYLSPLSEISKMSSIAVSSEDEAIAEGDVDYYQSVEKMLESDAASAEVDKDLQNTDEKQSEENKEKETKEDVKKEDKSSN